MGKEQEKEQHKEVEKEHSEEQGMQQVNVQQQEVEKEHNEQQEEGVGKGATQGGGEGVQLGAGGRSRRRSDTKRWIRNGRKIQSKRKATEKSGPKVPEGINKRMSRRKSIRAAKQGKSNKRKMSKHRHLRRSFNIKLFTTVIIIVRRSIYDSTVD